jgi:hypothetical protein
MEFNKYVILRWFQNGAFYLCDLAPIKSRKTLFLGTCLKNRVFWYIVIRNPFCAARTLRCKLIRWNDCFLFRQKVYSKDSLFYNPLKHFLCSLASFPLFCIVHLRINFLCQEPKFTEQNRKNIAVLLCSCLSAMIPRLFFLYLYVYICFLNQ